MKSASYQDTVGNITTGVDIKFEWDKIDKSGYTKITPKSFLPFQQDSDTVYISIIHIMNKNVSMYLNIVANLISE
jgi:hypothetical protein